MTRTRSSTALPPGAPEIDLLGVRPSGPPLPSGPFLVVGLGRGHIPHEAIDERGSFVHLHDATAAREIVEALA